MGRPIVPLLAAVLLLAGRTHAHEDEPHAPGCVHLAQATEPNHGAGAGVQGLGVARGVNNATPTLVASLDDDSPKLSGEPDRAKWHNLVWKIALLWLIGLVVFGWLGSRLWAYARDEEQQS